ncbi:SusC/RagA family TonB-linked outer membrane protein [Flagellimonas sp.]|uniref:SusC/RagA family TonB-linked outer membrane protein n=1 Tax=Flagellimonas sp. TaxID=2058762 RepID=UPI003B50DAB4
MNSFAFKQLIRLTFKTFFAAIVIALINPMFASDARGQKLDSYYVNLSVEDATVVDIIKKIEDQTQFKFVYGDKLNRLNDRFYFNEGNMSLRSILEIMAMEAGLTFKRIDRNISVQIKPKAKIKVLEEPVQTEITGTVVDEDNVPLSGATILVKGTTNGVAADFDGNFSISASKGDILVISYVGFNSKEITVGDQTQITVILLASNQLEEVVVTALGIKKEKRKVGYAVQEIKGESLQKAIAPNVVESLTGKVAGLIVTNNGADFFSDPGIFLRGREPLLVIDGVPQENSDFWNISSDDIESITVLKGTAASALYGSVGINGALQVTMKSGKGQEGTVVSFNSSTTFQGSFIRIPKIQTEYGPGNNGFFRYGGGLAGGDGLTQGGGINDFDYSIWGPKFDGRLLEQFDSPIDPVTGFRIPTPWVSRGPDNLRNFMEVGLLTSNNITVQTNTEKGSFIISNTYKYSKASTPGQRLDINTIRLRGSLDLTDKTVLEGSLQHNYQFSDNRIRGSYGPTSPIYNLAIWGGAHYDIRNFRNPWEEGKEGIRQNFVEHWRFNNPYAMAHGWKRPWTKHDIISFLRIDHQFNENLRAYVRTTLNTHSLTDNEEISKDIYNYDIPDRQGRFRYNSTRYFENNTDFLISYNNSFFNDDFGINATLGGNQRYIRRRLESASTTQLIVPEVFTLQNSVDQVTPTSSVHKKGVYSGYATLDLSYKNQFYVGATGRVDQSSSLVRNNNRFFYPSVYFSAVLSDVFNLPEAISFLKLRTAFASVGGDQIGNADNPLDDVYNGVNSYDTGRWRNNPTATFPSILENPNLNPEFNTSYEYGAELKLFKGRFGIDFSYYENTFGPQIFEQSFSSASGYSGIRSNGRKTQTRGMDFSITAIPVQTRDFSWSTIINFDKFKSYLISLPPLEDGTIPEREGRVYVGEELNRYFWFEWDRTSDGQLVIGDNGLPVSSPRRDLGNTAPDFTASINNTIRYKNLSLNFLIDGRFGGTSFDRYSRDLWRSGSHEDAVHPEREQSNIALATGGDARTMLIEGMSVVSGDVTFDPEGNVLEDTRVFEPNSTKVTYQNWAQNYKGDWRSVQIEKTFAKLREVTLSYNVPSKILDKTFLKSATVSLIGRNLLYWTKDDTFQDLDTYTLITGDTDLQQPSQRTYGFNLNLQF